MVKLLSIKRDVMYTMPPHLIQFDKEKKKEEKNISYPITNDAPTAAQHRNPWGDPLLPSMTFPVEYKVLNFSTVIFFTVCSVA